MKESEAYVVRVLVCALSLYYCMKSQTRVGEKMGREYVEYIHDMLSQIINCVKRSFY